MKKCKMCNSYQIGKVAMCGNCDRLFPIKRDRCNCGSDNVDVCLECGSYSIKEVEVTNE